MQKREAPNYMLFAHAGFLREKSEVVCSVKDFIRKLQFISAHTRQYFVGILKQKIYGAAKFLSSKREMSHNMEYTAIWVSCTYFNFNAAFLVHICTYVGNSVAIFFLKVQLTFLDDCFLWWTFQFQMRTGALCFTLKINYNFCIFIYNYMCYQHCLFFTSYPCT